MSDLQEFPIPKWLNSSYIKDILAAKFPDKKDVEVTSFHVAVGSKKGEGYMSELFRLRVESSVGTYSLIVKKPHSSEEQYDLLHPYHFFPTEISFYTDYLPDIQAALQSCREDEALVPELFYADMGREVLIMDDLAVKGYKAGDRDNRLTFDQAALVLKKLAKYHAGSMVANKNNKGKFSAHPFDAFGIDGGFVEVLILNARAMGEEIKSFGEEFQSVAKKWPLFVDNFVRLLGENMLSKRQLNVLIHGDLWFSNLMFKQLEKGEEVLEDVLLIDFQLSGWGSMAIDLIHFCFTSLNEKDYENHLEELLEIYHGNLARVLKKLNWEEIPTLMDVLSEFEDKIVHGQFEESFLFHPFYFYFNLQPPSSALQRATLQWMHRKLI